MRFSLSLILFFLLIPSLSLVLCQTHFFLMEFQNASYTKRGRERGERRRYLHTHTLNEHFHNSLSHFFSLLYTSPAITIFPFIQHNSRLPVFQNTHTQHYTYVKKTQYFIFISLVHYLTTKFSSNTLFYHSFAHKIYSIKSNHQN